MTGHAECGRGWSGRCAASTGKKCRCKCGGANHGTAHQSSAGDVYGSDEYNARFLVEQDKPDRLVIRDIGHETHRSVTNDAENVVATLAGKLGNRRLFYYDSMGEMDELLVKNGQFAGFAPGPERRAIA